MSIEIRLGYIEQDIVALCEDAEASYAFFGKLQEDKSYRVRMSSSHGVITSGTFKPGVGTREMVYYSLAKHLEAVDEAQQAENNSDPLLN